MYSKLVDCTVLSTNHSGKRTHVVDRITPHCVVGQLKAESIGGCFTSASRRASCNYGIGTEGRICLIVDEDNRSWCTSSATNDQRAITIECASDSTEPYKFNDAVYNRLIDLTVDILKRYNRNKLVYIADKTSALKYEPKDNEMLLTFHRWYANKSCPGNWFVSKAEEYVGAVNKILGTNNNTNNNNTIETDKTFKVGDVVKLKTNATQYNGKSIKEVYKNKEYTVKEINNDRVVLIIDNIVVYAVNIKNISLLEDTVIQFKDYKVKITANALNYRSGPGLSFKINGVIRNQGVYNIVEEKDGWGKLKSGAGWINLSYTKKI